MPIHTWRYNIGGGDITLSPFTCQVKFQQRKASDPQSTPLRSTNHREELMSRGYC